MKAWLKGGLIVILVLSLVFFGSSIKVGEQEEEFFKDYLTKYLTEEYVNEHFEIIKTKYEPQYDRNCYTYKIKFGNQIAGTGSGIINEVDGLGPGEIACFNGRKINLYHGPKTEFVLNINQEEAEGIMQSNDCTLSLFKDETPALYITNEGFWWEGNQNLTVVCKVNAENGEFKLDIK